MIKRPSLLMPQPHTPILADTFLARHANCIYWVGRYLERAENLARLLEITYIFTPASMGAQNWQSVISLHEDEKAFATRYSAVNATNAIRFYLSDRSHPNSIMSCLETARGNASQLRAVISTDMWVQINVMYNDMLAIAEKPISMPDLNHALSRIRRQCQTHHGLAEGTLYRDQGWYFYLLGKYMERADQITRLLDIKYHLLLPSPEDVGSVIDASQWFALLRAANAYHAFRREHPYVISPATVAGFLLCDRRFPRSASCCLKTVSNALGKLQRDYQLPQIEGIITQSDSLRHQLLSTGIDQIIGAGLHEYLDHIQMQLSAVTQQISGQYFQ